MNTLYNLLGIAPDADNETIKKAFREAVKATHPDIHADDPDARSRFGEIVAAYALLRDAKQRATYDWLLQQRFRLKTEYQQRQSKHEPQRLRLKRMRVIVPQAIAAVVLTAALVHGYRLFVPIPNTGVVTVKQDANHTSTAIAVVRADTTKVDMDKAGEPVEAAGAQLTEPAPDRGEPGHKHDRGGFFNTLSKPSPGASAANSGDTNVIGRELAVGPPTNDANFYRERGIVSYRSGDLVQAIAELDEAIRLDPDNAQDHDIRANAWDEMGVFDRALADYDEAIRINPNNPAVFRDRAIMWQRKGELDKALVDLDRAIRFSFADASIYCDRGLVWYEKGGHDRAIADFDHAIKLDPDSATACINRGLISHELPNASERVPIWPGQWPWSSIGRINIAIGTQRSICTGSLVGPRAVITAAHCLFDERMNQWIKPNVVHFVAGLSPGLRYSGHSAVSSYVVSPKFKTGLEDQLPEYRYSAQRKLLSPTVAMAKTDWAVLILENPLNLQPIPIQPTQEAELPGSDTEKEIVLPGYAADRRELLAISRGCGVKTDVQEMGQGSLAHTCDIAAGGSGSPILLLQHRNAAVIGIATAARIGLPYLPARGGIGVSATEFAHAVSAAPR
jgi:curved DNA-binding protein CbpA/V8-like Glu-specific endopeptidase